MNSRHLGPDKKKIRQHLQDGPVLSHPRLCRGGAAFVQQHLPGAAVHFLSLLTASFSCCQGCINQRGASLQLEWKCMLVWLKSWLANTSGRYDRKHAVLRISGLKARLFLL